ncbi:MAG: NADH-quinone oxidoreductase subunit A [Desulfobacterales bacterium]|nr:NADH-quinone oxidoreductase subunit A [Desulfobacterales bacterium]MBS3755067.1 NADH-quinone oxidoreductase subunit A [Desulfobacterales bacterium]
MEPLDAIAVLSPWEPGLFGLFAFTLAIFVMMGLLLVLTSRLGDKTSNPEKPRPYESGIIPTGSARLRYPVPFFLVAGFFLIFDVEGAFIFSWAAAAQTLGWKGWLQMAFFIFVLFCGLVYIWRKGGLDWGGKTRIE